MSPSSGINILIVDDDPDYREAMRMSLRALDCDIWEAKNGLEAIHLAQIIPGLQLVLMDIGMPVMHGVAALKNLREKQPGIKTVAVTGQSHSDREKYLSEGFDDFLAKPFTRDDVFTVIRRLLPECKLR